MITNTFPYPPELNMAACHLCTISTDDEAIKYIKKHDYNHGYTAIIQQKNKAYDWTTIQAYYLQYDHRVVQQSG